MILNDDGQGRPLFIGEGILVEFLDAPTHMKTPGCPNVFHWRGQRFGVADVVSEWKDFSRHGRLSRNMRPAHAERAGIKGSRGSGRFYFRVRTTEERIFDLYYDRMVKDVTDHLGEWVLFREFLKE